MNFNYVNTEDMRSIITFILLLTATTTSVLAQKSNGYLMATQKLTLRTGPGTNYNTVAEVPKGTQVYVLSSNYGEWSTIQYKHMNGFVRTSYLSEDNSLAEASAAAQAAEARKLAAKRAAESAIKKAQEAKEAAERAARLAIQEAERLTREAEAEALAAAAAADAAKKNMSAAELRRRQEQLETEKALKAQGQSAIADNNPIESRTASAGKNSPKSTSNITKESKFADWEKKTYKSGATPKSFKTFKGKFEYKLDNYLKLEVGKNTDVVVKLVRMGKTEKDDETIRIVYINSNSTQYIRNIPEGEYYCVIAYGKDWREQGDGKGTFTKNALYERGQDILDYNTIKGPDGINVPSYSLSLDLLTNGSQSYDSGSDNITDTSFNNY